METFVLAGGCFWCLDATLSNIRGITKLECGYTGGHAIQPTYEQVCTGTTGHAEAIRITFDPDVIPADRVLDFFFVLHNPTTLNRQGNDIGTQYRSAMFYTGPQQQQTFAEAIERTAELWSDPIVTELTPLEDFYVAEDYHQNYFEKNPQNTYCNVTINPKLSKLRKNYAEWLV